MSFFSPKVLTSLSLTNLSSNVKVNVTLVRMKTSFVWLFFFNTSPWWEIIRFTKEDGWNGPTQWNVVIYIGVEVSFLISIRELGKKKKKTIWCYTCIIGSILLVEMIILVNQIIFLFWQYTITRRWATKKKEKTTAIVPILQRSKNPLQ